MNSDDFLVRPDRPFRLKDIDPDSTRGLGDKAEAAESLDRDVLALAELQDILYAQNTYALLVILQAMDAAGKDSVVKHVFSGVNPNGCHVVSFKAPSAEELDHDYLWRCMKMLPERGRIGVFNRSYYEEVLVVRVNPGILERQNLPPEARGKDIWKRRFEEINAFERYLVANWMVIMKFFLHVSRDEQKKRFLERIERPEKNWKFSIGDLGPRAQWKEYMEAYEEAMEKTSTEWAPWYAVPADHKWYTRAVVADLIVERLRKLDLRYPELTAAQTKELREAKQQLEAAE